MGLTKTNYYVEDLDVTLDNAYAICTNASVSIENIAVAHFSIYKSREDAVRRIKKPFKDVSFLIENFDRSKPIFEQIYSYAKEHGFEDWEDDIVE